jgi:hypothetical protein
LFLEGEQVPRAQVTIDRLEEVALDEFGVVVVPRFLAGATLGLAEG